MQVLCDDGDARQEVRATHWLVFILSQFGVMMASLLQFVCMFIYLALRFLFTPVPGLCLYATHVVRRSDIDLSVKSKQGLDPLHLAAHLGDIQALVLLMAWGANPNTGPS